MAAMTAADIVQQVQRWQVLSATTTGVTTTHCPEAFL